MVLAGADQHAHGPAPGRAALRLDRRVDVARQAVSVALIVALVLAGGGPATPFFAVTIPAGLVTVALRRPCSCAATSRCAPASAAPNGGRWLRDTLPYAAAIAVNTLYFRVTIVVMSLVAAARSRPATSRPRSGSPRSSSGSRRWPSGRRSRSCRAQPARTRSLRLCDRAHHRACADRRRCARRSVVLSAPFVIDVLAGSDAGRPPPAVLQIQGVALVAHVPRRRHRSAAVAAPPRRPAHRQRLGARDQHRADADPGAGGSGARRGDRGGGRRELRWRSDSSWLLRLRRLGGPPRVRLLPAIALAGGRRERRRCSSSGLHPSALSSGYGLYAAILAALWATLPPGAARSRAPATPHEPYTPRRRMTSTCRFCGSTLEHIFVDLGMSPLAKSYLPPDRPTPWSRSTPCRVRLPQVLARAARTVRRRRTTSSREYAYFSSYSDSWVEHARRYTSSMIASASARPRQPGRRAGQQRRLPAAVVRRAPASPCLGSSRPPTWPQAAESGRPDAGRVLRRRDGPGAGGRGRRADLLIGNNVLAQVPDLNDFVAGMKLLLSPGRGGHDRVPAPAAPDRRATSSTPSTTSTSPTSRSSPSASVFAAHGLELFDVEELPTHGGSLRIYARHADDDGKPVSDACARAAGASEAAGYERDRDLRPLSRSGCRRPSARSCRS